MPDPELQKIVSRMVKAGEPEANIKLVVQNYKASTTKPDLGGGGFIETAEDDHFQFDLSARQKGALAGSLWGTAIKPGAGTVIGAFIGGLTAQGIEMTGQHAKGAEEAPKDFNEVMNRLTFGVAATGVEEALGHGFYKFGGKVLSPFGRYVTKEGRLAWETLEKYMPKRTSPVPPAHMTENWALDLMQNIAEKSWFGGSKQATYHNITSPKAIDNFFADLVGEFRLGVSDDPVALGNLLSASLTDNWKAYRKIFTDPLYKTVEELTKPVIKKIPKTKLVDTGLLDEVGNPIVKQAADGFMEQEVGGVAINIRPLKDAVKKQYSEIKQLPDFAADTAGDNVVTGIMKMNDEVPFGVAKSLATRLRAVSDDLSIVNKNAPGIGVAKHLSGLLHDSTSGALKKYNPEAWSLWKKANDLYKKGNTQYNNRFIRQIVRMADPEVGVGAEKIVSTVFRNKGVTGLRKIKSAVSPIEWGQLKGWYVADVISKSTNKEGVIVGKTLKNKLFGGTGMGKQAMETIFTKEEIKRLNDSALVSGVLQARQASGTGGMLIQLMQPTGVTMMIGGKVGGSPIMMATGASMLVTPAVLSRMLLNKKIAAWMTSAARMPKPTGLIVSNTARLAGFVDEINREIYDEMLQLQKEE